MAIAVHPFRLLAVIGEAFAAAAAAAAAADAFVISVYSHWASLVRLVVVIRI